MNAKAYALKYLTKECQEIIAGNKSQLHPELSVYEKAIIYKYSVDGYLALNHKLRAAKGKNASPFGKLLVQTLNKLNNYNSTVYRKVQLTKAQQAIYLKALKHESYVNEPAFSSTSKEKKLALLFPGNTLFIIISKSGKDIEKIAKFGYHHSHNEYEVLFLPNTKFEVLEVSKRSRKFVTITMEEI